VARALRRLRCPVVDVSAARLLPELPWVETDDAAIARLAFDHLRDRGFSRLAFCGDRRFNWSRWRRMHFQDLAEAAGYSCAVYEAPQRPRSWSAERGALLGWLRSLPAPVGVFACYDAQAQRLLDCCRECGIAVPERCAVLGVDNDDVLCELCDPPLSSIAPDTLRSGYRAAEVLARLLRGDSVPRAGELIPPRGLVARQSSDVLAIEDPALAAGLRFIRAHACEGITVRDVLRGLPVSRRVFEHRFRQHFGRSPHQEIVRQRMLLAERLLRESELSQAAIAERVGFEHPEYLSVAFKRYSGLSPSAWRARHAEPGR